MWQVTTASGVITAMYFFAGLQKLYSPSGAAQRVIDRFEQIPALRWASAAPVAKTLVFVTGVTLTVAPLLVVYSTLTRERLWKKIGMWAALALAAFTVIVTLVFFFPPTKARTYFPFISNVTAFGGLVLLAHVIHAL